MGGAAGRADLLGWSLFRGPLFLHLVLSLHLLISLMTWLFLPKKDSTESPVGAGLPCTGGSSLRPKAANWLRSGCQHHGHGGLVGAQSQGRGGGDSRGVRQAQVLVLLLPPAAWVTSASSS